MAALLAAGWRPAWAQALPCDGFQDAGQILELG